MASKAVKELNSSKKGRTGPMTVEQRKKRGMKARPAGVKTTKGKPSRKKA